MGRTILAVILGYVVMFFLVFLLFTGAYFAMGAEGAFQPASYYPSTLWLAVSFALGFVAALAAGCTAVWIGRKITAGYALAGLVFVLGLVFAIPTIMNPVDTSTMVRTGDVSNLEAMQNARQPLWVALVNPFLGAVGVMIGARLKGAPSA